MSQLLFSLHNGETIVLWPLMPLLALLPYNLSDTIKDPWRSDHLLPLITS